MTSAARVPEIALSAAWNTGQIPEHLVTADGQNVRVIHRGTWTHGLGPDFSDALLLFNDRELRSGAVEVHMETRGWQDHGHHVDPSYDAVILHVVARHDGSISRRADGAFVPVTEVSLPDTALLPMAMLDWDRVGGSVCAPRLANSSPAALRAIFHALGDVRLSARSAQLETQLFEIPPDEVLWRVMLAGLGYSRNQSPMQRLAEYVPFATLGDLRLSQRSSGRFHVTLGLLLGVAGFLPLTPGEAQMVGLAPSEVIQVESSWHALGSPWHDDRFRPSEWDRARTRPGNHPLLRIHAAAAIAHNVAPQGSLLGTVRAIIRAEDPVAELRGLTRIGGMPGIGTDRAIEIYASGILPALFSVASHSADEALTDDAAQLWESLPAPAATSVTRRALRQVCGDVTLRAIGARGAQGLIHLDTGLCLPRRCFDCPVARAELTVNE